MAETKKTAVAAKTAEPAEKKDKYIYAKGGRKTAVAQIRLFKKGKGEFIVNDKKMTEYFPTERLQRVFLDALVLTGHDKDIDLTVKTHSGGMDGQAAAARHGIARALVILDETLRPALRAQGYMTRDPRVKERKKPGLKRARRAPQWSKR